MRTESQDLDNKTDVLLPTAALIFVLLVCLSLIGITAWSTWNARAAHLQEQERVTANLARSVAQHADDTFKAADTALIGLTARLADDGPSPQTLQRLRPLLIRRVAELPALRGLAIYDKDGNVLVNARSIFDPHLNIRERDYFRYHLQHDDLGPHIGAPIYNGPNREWVIPLSRRLNDAHGKFVGVVLATVGSNYFYQFYASYDIGHDGLILLVLTEGLQLLRWPIMPDSVGKDIKKGPLFSLYTSEIESGNAVFTSPTDGLKRLSSYNHLAHYPLAAVVAVSKKEVLAGWDQTTLTQSAIVALISGLLAFLGFRLVAQIKLRTVAERDAKLAEEEANRAGEELRKLNQTLQKLALQDSLTGLANRRQFDMMLQEELSRATRSGSSLALVLIDVDFFKQYNDLYGHLGGDECLRQIGKVLKASEQRPGDMAARYGGEEFAVLLPITDAAGAVKVAEHIRKTLHALAIPHEASSAGHVTVSAGVHAVTPGVLDDSVGTLLRAADAALYVAKAAGRDQVQAYSGGA